MNQLGHGTEKSVSDDCVTGIAQNRSQSAGLVISCKKLVELSARWNSTYDMLKFSLAYRVVIDHITVDKHLKLRRYKLDNDDWAIVEDLVSVL